MAGFSGKTNRVIEKVTLLVETQGDHLFKMMVEDADSPTM